MAKKIPKHRKRRKKKKSQPGEYLPTAHSSLYSKTVLLETQITKTKLETYSKGTLMILE